MWGQNVDNDVFPYVLEYLETYAKPVQGAKAEEQHKEDLPPSPPAYSRTVPLVTGLRKRDVTSQPEPGLSYAKVAVGDERPSAERKPGLSYAKVAAEQASESSGSDSDQTIGDEHDARIQPGASFADVAKAGAERGTEADVGKHNKHGQSADDNAIAPGIDTHVTSEVSYADMASK